MTKEQEQLERLERSQEDYFYVLNVLKGNEDMICLSEKAMRIIRKAINLELLLIESEIRALKKKGVNYEQPCEDTQKDQTADVSQM